MALLASVAAVVASSKFSIVFANSSAAFVSASVASGILVWASVDAFVAFSNSFSALATLAAPNVLAAFTALVAAFTALVAALGALWTKSVSLANSFFAASSVFSAYEFASFARASLFLLSIKTVSRSVLVLSTTSLTSNQSITSLVWGGVK